MTGEEATLAFGRRVQLAYPGSARRDDDPTGRIASGVFYSVEFDGEDRPCNPVPCVSVELDKSVSFAGHWSGSAVVCGVEHLVLID